MHYAPLIFLLFFLYQQKLSFQHSFYWELQKRYTHDWFQETAAPNDFFLQQKYFVKVTENVIFKKKLNSLDHYALYEWNYCTEVYFCLSTDDEKIKCK